MLIYYFDVSSPTEEEHKVVTVKANIVAKLSLAIDRGKALSISSAKKRKVPAKKLVLAASNDSPK